MLTKEQKELWLLIRKLERQVRSARRHLQQNPNDEQVIVTTDRLEKLIQTAKTFARSEK